MRSARARPAGDGPAVAPAGEIRAALLAHYDERRRSLPWRDTDDPYRIWVSEVMLQQTRVETVVPYYLRWIERFPDLNALARADEDAVLSAWEGLGYYSRARNLHAAARVIRDRYAGRLPRSPEALAGLPGFGSYTVGAVASIAFGAAVPAVDGNVRRVLSRLYDLVAPNAAELAGRAAALVDPARPGDFNQALMELGATVCKPRAPACPSCPLETVCAARARDSVHLRPAQRVRKAVPSKSFAVAVITDPCGRMLLVRRPNRGLLAGMWAFPEADLGAGVQKEPGARAAALRIAERLGFAAARAPDALPAVEHAFTHLRARYLPVLVGVSEDARGDAEERRWVHAPSAGVAMPSAQKRIMKAAAARLAERPARPALPQSQSDPLPTKRAP